MRNKVLKRLLVLVMSGALVVGTCMPSLAADTGTVEIAEETGEASDSTVETSDETSDSGSSEDTSGDTSDSTTVKSVTGGDTITENGTYALAEGSTGVITITAQKVTIIGDEEKTYTDLSLDCNTAGTFLTIEDVRISSTASNNIIDVTGTGNYLYLAGTNLLDRESSTNYAVIHVGADAGLTIADAPDDDATGVLYMYKSDQAAGIGGDSAELNGSITFESGRIFAKGSKQGAVIGTGANASGTPGTISFTGGEYYLIANARGALIGGGAGSSGGTAGGVVNISGGTLTLNVDWTGAAIGGGGFSAGNDASGGQLIVTGGSVRTFIDYNAISGWSVTEAGVNDVAITAEKVDDSGESVVLYTLDTTQFADADTYDVKVDGSSFYSGGLHAYSYINEQYDQSDQIDINDTTDNWEACEDTNLYLYLTKKSHVITVNGQSIGITWNADTGSFTAGPVTAAATGEGSVSVSNPLAAKDEVVTVTAVPDDGYYLAQVRYTYNNGTEDVTKVVSEKDGSYSFTMPADEVSVTADFVSVAWDGTIDVSWYDPDAEVYTISYAAQFAGAAALNNGLFNNYPSVTYEGGDYTIPYTTESYLPYGSEDTYYNVYSQGEDSTVVVGDISYVKAYCSTGSYGASNPVTSKSYWYGAEDFGGKTILLAADLDMGGSYTDTLTDPDSWSGPNYMPLGGQYCIYEEDEYSLLSSSFNGTLNGQGHIVYNIYCYRHATDYTLGQSIGLIGRLGVADSDSEELYESPVVENVAVAGMIYGNRSVGGIVGKSGMSNGSLIENCINFATVQNADTKGVGGIAGTGWNDLEIRNCANFGYIACNYSSNAGGISGTCEAAVSNCYNFGYVYASSSSYSQALGTNNGGSSWTNCYYLEGSSASTSAPGVYKYSTTDTFYAVASADTFKTTDFLDQINDGGREWVLDSAETIKSSVVQNCLENVYAYTSSLSDYNASGFAIPRAFINDTSSFTGVETTGSIKTEYTVFESLDLNDLQLWAAYSDNTKEEITDYEVTVSTGSETFTTADVGSGVTVTVSGSYNGSAYSFSYPLTITDTTLESIAITTQPSNTVYAIGEAFDPTGMVVTATYANGVSAEVTDYTYDLTGALTADASQVTVSYTYNGTTLSQTVAITMLADAAPAVTENVVQIENASDMMWFANQVSLGNFYDAILINDIDLSGVTYTPAGQYTSGSSVARQYYTGTFDGNEKSITLALDTTEAATQDTALFAGLATGGTIRDLTLNGTISSAGNYTAAAVAYSKGGRIENVTSNVTITGTKNYTVGIIGYNYTGELILIDCVNNGTVTSSGNFTAGLAGYGANIQIINGVNNAAISGAQYTAGIIGFPTNDSTVIGCINEGSITGTGKYSGGIAAYGNKSEIRGCVNRAGVSGEGCNGGIVGYMVGDSSVISGCMNYADITGTFYVGGVLGQAAAKITISACGNEGNIAGTATSGTYYSVGGVVGYLYSASIDSSYNSGDVSNTYRYAGGVVGHTASTSASITNCYNTGSVSNTCTSTGAYVGGLIGYTSYKAVHTNNYNTGDLSYSGSLASSKVYIGGLIGYAAKTTMSNTSNNYALEGTASIVIGYNTTYTDAMAMFVSADELKTYATVADGAESSTLGSAYTEDTALINSGYPVLTWQTASAADVIAMIDAIGTVTGDSLTAIENAFAAYAALSAAEQANVTNYTTLVEAYDTYLTITAQAEEIEALIDAIGTVTLESSDAITAARTAYDAASDVVKALVSNVETLTAAEESYANLVAADAVDTLILAIGEVTLESSDAITAARAAYDASTEAVQALVRNYAVLTEAESTYDSLRAAETDGLIEAIGEVTVESGDAIDAARASYDALTETQQELVTLYEVLTAAEQAYLEARAQEVDDLVEAITSISFSSGSDLALIQAKYDALTDAQKALVNSLTQYEKYCATYLNLMASLEKTYTITKQVLLDGSDVVLETYETQDASLTYSYVWYRIDADTNEKTEAGTGSTLNLGSDLAVGSYTYTCEVTVNDGSDTYRAGTYIYTLLIVTQEYIAAVDGAQKTVALIDAIGEVTLESGDAIEAARTAYDGLDETGRLFVTNADTLTAAESTYAELVAAVEAEQAALEAAAAAVEELIDAIDTVTLASGDAIEAARAAYEALSDEEKALVTNLSALVLAENAYAVLCETQEAADAALLEAQNAADAALSEVQEAANNAVAAPVIKSVTNVKKGVKLTWSAPKNAQSYQIYRMTGTGSYELLAEVSGNAYTDKTAKNGKTYTYKIVAVNGDIVSEDSESEQIVRLAQAVVKKLKNQSGKKVKITVKTNKKAAGYEIVYSTNKKFSKSIVVKTSKQAKTVIKNLKKNKRYYVKVRSYKKVNGETVYSSWSAVKSVKVKK